ncbi:MAG: BlaI/MecI/CopY family transcriptional regulator [Ruminococcaceae bacterium]|nr:BlaI/MecI/CopY family transcriptional regulator [Oscillospiraceae bacterium]
MSIENISIGDGELEIMKVIWSKDEAVSTQEITKAVEAKGWKRTTISTFLSRLVEKGALVSEKQGNNYFYRPLISKRDYSSMKAKSLISSLFDGSAKQLCASLFEDGNLSQKDIEELRAIFTKDDNND